jgi:diguanylate cyclase (GGDEF)-like protein/PAS domain S-box-containing protein
MLRRSSLGVAARLAILLSALAALSTGLALILQDRALDQDLRQAARGRLERSALAADRLIGNHLRDIASRYSAISRAPEFRANLEVVHGPTLRYYAAQLLDGQSATLVAFLGRDSEILAPAGDPRLARSLDDRLRGGFPLEASPCVTAGEPGPRPDRTSADPGGVFGPCRYPEGPAEATLFSSSDEVHTLVLIPLRTGEALVGGLVALEQVTPQLVAEWSNLSGGTINLAHATPGSDLEAVVRRFPGVHVKVATTYDAERGVIRRARRNLAVSGLAVLVLALGASWLLARGFARPIVQMREATERLGKGQLDQRIELHRNDEIGQLAQAFNDLVQRLRESQERLRRAQRLARFGNWYLDSETRTVTSTPEVNRLFGLQEEESVLDWDRWLTRIHPEDRRQVESAVVRSRRRGAPFRVDVRVQHASGRTSILHLRGQPRSEDSGRIDASAQDVTERRTAEEQIRYLSLHDALTGLGNREYLRERLGLRLRGHHSRRPLALLFIGLDDFQAVNDTFGHAVGDTLLSEVAARLIETTSFLSSDEDGERSTETVVRTAGDRFGLILDDIADEEEAARVAQLILARIGEPYTIGEEEISLTARIGIALWPDDAEDADTLLRNCDTALHRSKLSGREQYGFFDESMHEDASRRLRLANLLRQAIERGALDLHFQPRVRTDTGRVVGFEALASWTEPELGPVSPTEFIPIAEATGSIGPLGEWALETAAQQLREWHQAGHTDVSMSVNLSRHELRPGLVERAMEKTEGLDRSRFELEVTESALIEDGAEAVNILGELRAHGFRIALDDFGTGYSSLHYLQGLPIDTVKIDRAFIRRIAEDEDTAALTGSVIAMCRALRLHTVVEGVETEEQRAVLLGLGCEEAQGFLFSPPMPAEETWAFLESGAKVEANDTSTLAEEARRGTRDHRRLTSRLASPSPKR